MTGIVIDPEFKSHIRPLKPMEREGLEKSLHENGCLDPIKVWKETGILLDGHNRYEICTEHDIVYRIEYLFFENREDALDWLIDNQLGRRNLTPDEMAYLRGKLYNRSKQSEGTNRYTSKRPQNGDTKRTVEKLASQTGVSKNTVERDGKFADSVDKLAGKFGDSIREKILSGEVKTTRKEVQSLADRLDSEPEKVEAVVEHVKLGNVESIKEATEKENIKHSLVALQSSNTNEWYTPERYVNTARQLMGGIDVDPASNPIANEVVKATTYYTIDTNGLGRDWIGNVWLNPPYGRSGGDSNQDMWAQYLIEQYQKGNTKQAVLLVNAVTDRKWFQPLWDYPICFTDHRIRFYTPDKELGQPTHGNALVYFGDNVSGFVELFSQFGVVVARIRNVSSEVKNIA